MLNHEFRTPLATIDGAIQRLEATSSHADEPTRTRYRKIGAAVDRLIGMLDEYLSPDRMAALGRARQPNTITVRDLVDSGAVQIRAAGREAALRLEELPLTLRGEPEGLRLALKVLIDNALAFSPPSAPVILRARPAAAESSWRCWTAAPACRRRTWRGSSTRATAAAMPPACPAAASVCTWRARSSRCMAVC